MAKINKINKNGATYDIEDAAAARSTSLTAETQARQNADSSLQTAINGKQDALSTAQLSAVNSGITAEKVTKLDNIAAGAEVNVQSNWNETDTSSDAYIQNKPTIPTVNDATLTITQNGTSAGTFTANASTDATIALTDTTYSAFTGATASTAGAAGLVPAPAAGDESKVLKGDGTWAVPADAIKMLTIADCNYPTDNPTTIALWKLAPGIYSTEASAISCSANAAESSYIRQGDLVVVSSTGLSTYVSIMVFGRAGVSGAFPKPQFFVVHIATGYPQDTSGASWNGVMLGQDIVQTEGSSQNTVMSQHATTAALNSRVLKNAGAPTTSTVGTIGQLLEDTTNGKLYQCTAIDNTDPNAPVYTWTEVGAGGGGPTVVQTTGTSTTDVMSQNAVTSMVFNDPSSKNSIQIGSGASASNTYDVAIGSSARSGSSGVAIGWSAGAFGRGNNSVILGSSAYTSGNGSMAFGMGANALGAGAIALGTGSSASSAGEMSIGTGNSSYGYNSSYYRLLTGVYDGQSAHDAATKGQLDSIAIKGAGAPTTSTTGAVGQLYEDTTNGKLYICTAIVPGTDPDPDTYTWTEVGAGGGGGGGGIHTLTTADVNWQDPNNSDRGTVALWLMEPGIYMLDYTAQNKPYVATDYSDPEEDAYTNLIGESATIIITPPNNADDSKRFFIFGEGFTDVQSWRVDENGAQLDGDSLISSTTAQGIIESAISTVSSAPTIYTEGNEGEIRTYIDSSYEAHMYVCTYVDWEAEPVEYTWKLIGESV